MTTKTQQPGIELRTMPQASYEFLRFQIGRKETRPEQTAIYDGKHIIGERQTLNQATVFRLLGWGETLKQAERMAGIEL